MIRRVLRRLRSEQSGFTLVELLVACTVGSLVLLATFMMLDSSVVLTGRVTDRVDRTARSRTAMEAITRKLRSQVCAAAGVPALIDAQDYSVKFYAFTKAGAFVPDQVELAWDTNTNSIVQRTWAGTGAAPYTTFASTPATSTVLTDVLPPFVSGNSGPRGPIFRYYVSGSSTPLSTPLSTANLKAASKVDITFMTYPLGRGGNGSSTTLQSEAFARTADPNAQYGTTSPECA
jgi:prepilin-type N-terminal cleavage/methylation domain-containing protein